MENLDCPDLIEAFEETYTSKRQWRGEKRKDKKAERKYKGKPRGFDKGLEPDKIIGATDDSGELMFLISWKVCRELFLFFYKKKSSRAVMSMILSPRRRQTRSVHKR